jgi:hypothetical protein
LGWNGGYLLDAAGAVGCASSRWVHCVGGWVAAQSIARMIPSSAVACCNPLQLPAEAAAVGSSISVSLVAA